MLIEYDHTSNIFLRVRQAESTSLPPTHSCRTSPGLSRSLLWICTVFPQLDSQTAGDLFTSHPPTPSFILPKAPNGKAENEYITRKEQRVRNKVGRDLTIWALIILMQPDLLAIV